MFLSTHSLELSTVLNKPEFFQMDELKVKSIAFLLVNMQSVAHPFL